MIEEEKRGHQPSALPLPVRCEQRSTWTIAF